MRVLLRQLAVRAIVFGSLVAVGGCQLERPEEIRDLTLLPTDSGNGAGVMRAAPERDDCVNQFPQRVAVRGTLQREVRPGPPGYGETPQQDRRDTTLVLILARSVRVCIDSVLQPHGPSVIQIDRAQLEGRLDPQRYATGDSVVVYGGFRQPTLGRHYTPMVLHADSIVGRSARGAPGRRQALQPRRTVNDQLNQYWFFVDDSAAPDDLLQRVAEYCSALLRAPSV